ncbi:MAG TPA: putative LPS assembly protein LptD [Ferruginibacter sp.]|jgi:LPS-assembly protein|nr:putative LPS assembly protein LptD [Ferruginibacter sp.]
MNNVRKGKAKYILASLVMWLLLSTAQIGNGRGYRNTEIPACVICDMIPKHSHRISLPDSTKPVIAMDSNKLILPADTTNDSTHFRIKKDTLGFKVAKGALDAPVTYHADDSMIMDVPAKRITLYGKESQTAYKDNVLTAPGIEMNQGTGIVSAYFTKDSTGKVIAFPTYTDKDFKTVSDTIRFNMKNGKGITKGTYTQQGEMYVYGEKIKKVDADVFYAYRSRFTTCNLDTPHFAFVSRRIKFINQKLAITGPIHPEFEGVPIPIYLPFGIFPLTQGRHSGVLPPTFTEDQTLGLELAGLGYYKVINQYWDIITKGNIYSYGSWAIDVNPRYYKRYHYTGNFDFSYQYNKYNFVGDPDYSVAKTYQINWMHQSDSKAIPGQTFGAAVHYGSSRYNSYVTNNPVVPFNNSSNSSINYARTFKAYNYTINGTATQNSTTKRTDIALPSLSLNLNTLYPFRRKEAAGTLKWYENIGIGLNSAVQSTTHYYDDTTTKAFPQLNQNFQWGASHSVPISLSLPPVGILNISPSVSYTERWYQQKQTILLDNLQADKLDTTIQKGFYTARSMSFSLALTTKIYGMFTFGKHSKLQAIRHLITPTLSVTYTPNMNAKSYYNSYDTLGNLTRRSFYENGIYGAFSEQRFGGLTFGIENNIQAKVRGKSDTGATVKKITLIDQLNINGSYNFLADSFQLSPFTISASTNLFNKINITGGATLDPYEHTIYGQRVNRLVWKDKSFTLGQLTSANLALSTQFKGGDQSKKSPSHSLVQPYTNTDPTTGLPLNDYQQEASYVSNNPAAYTDFSVPWTINLSYSFGMSRATSTAIVNTYFSYVTEYNITQYVSWNGTLALTPKWQTGVTGSYDITNKDLGLISVTLARDMHCWQMAISISNSAVNRFFSISISPKASILSDLKINRTRSVNVEPGQ